MRQARFAIALLMVAVSTISTALPQTRSLLAGGVANEIRLSLITPEYGGKVNAPEFPEGMEWLNVESPLSLKNLRGKVVLLDFWTYCCINCMHILPDLKRLEHKYRNELVVIGVHSAKFTAEQDTENIRQAILRYEIEHPVVNDKDMVIWRRYNVRSWPTVFLIDPLGRTVASRPGEGVYEPFDRLIGRVIKEFDREGLLNRQAIEFNVERKRAASSVLSFPGKVLADAASRRLFISDSNHNRIIVASLYGDIEEVIGSGETGLEDGSFDEAAFNHPQGMALDGQTLYVADTENHAIRLADLQKRSVTTIAGTGKQASQFNIAGVGTDVAISSPWDLVLHEGNLYIAMAGPHQLWKMNLKTREVAPYAGSGREARVDGPLRQAALAQPSGLATDGKKLYFADSEVSSIRSADLEPNGRVETIVGLDLFVFGDQDGAGPRARLQHPLGVVYHDGVLYVADTYNNKIKKVFPETKEAVTFLGTGEEGLRDGDSPLFDEPGGVSVAGGKLYIADTNNHLIRVADLRSGRVSTLRLQGIDKLQQEGPKDTFFGETVALERQTLSPGGATLTISLELPSGYKLTSGAPSSVSLSIEGGALTFSGGGLKRTIRHPEFPTRVSLNGIEGEALVKADLVLYYCTAGSETLCYFKEVRLSLPAVVTPKANSRDIQITYRLPANR
jgi:thiol-disulfide isomerase/thioredoxin